MALLCSLLFLVCGDAVLDPNTANHFRRELPQARQYAIGLSAQQRNLAGTQF
jgi:hypothetical protein